MAITGSVSAPVNAEEENEMGTSYPRRDERSWYENATGPERGWERGYYGGRDRGLFERAGDEMRSWFGDEEA
jgi:hypothetical protein